MDFLLKGLILGFSIAAPVGPIGLLCIRRTLAEGRASGFVSGLGAATADGLYGFVAAFGLTAISGFLLNYLLCDCVILPYIISKNLDETVDEVLEDVRAKATEHDLSKIYFQMMGLRFMSAMKTLEDILARP